MVAHGEVKQVSKSVGQFSFDHCNEVFSC